MSKIERLLNLTAVLLDTERPLTAQEIRSQVEGYGVEDSGFNRMFERDKDDLRSMGVPIEVRPSPADPGTDGYLIACLLYTSPSPRDRQKSRMPSSA